MTLLALVVAAALGAAVALPVHRLEITSACLAGLDLLGIGYGVLAARRSRSRATWSLVTAGRLAFAVSNSLLYQDQIGLTGRPHGALYWAGGIIGCAMYVLWAAAAVTFSTRRLRGRQRSSLLFETLAVLGGGFMFVWYFVLRTHLQIAADRESWLVTVGFPLGDLLLMVGVAAVLLRGAVKASLQPVTLLICALALFVLADVIFNATSDYGVHASGPLPGTIAVVVAMFGLTVAPMWESHAARAAEPASPAGRLLALGWFTYLPFVAVVAALTLMVAVTLREGQLLTWGGLVLGLVLTTAGVAGAQLTAMRDTRRQLSVDPLTGLIDRTGLHRELSRGLRRGEPMALLLIDLDGFKTINDTYGQAGGDQVLQEVSELLRTTVRTGDVVARTRGDEFAVLQRHGPGPADVTALAHRLLGATAHHPIRLGDHQLTVRASVGAVASAPGDTGQDLQARADIALYQAKRAGAHDLVIYTPGMRDHRGDDAALGRDLADAVTGDQLRVLYQPMVDLATGLPKGVEALVRWHHPARGLVSPLEFIPIAERTGAIKGIGLYVLEQAARQVRTWHDDGHDLYASVNLSPRQLQDTALVEDVLAVLARTGLAPDRLVLEVTESALVDDHIALAALQDLRAHGIRIAIDDFGTGYSSLQYLARLPVDTLKIDRSFVTELGSTTHSLAITEAVVRLAEILDLTTVAEGVETEDQAARLRGLGCRTGQGYLFARPLSPDDATTFLAEGRTAGVLR